MNFVEGKSLRAFVTAYDPTFQHGSPGMVLMMDYIRWAFDNGLNEVDFLTGDEDFKNRLANEAVPLASIAGPGSVLGRIAMLADEWAPAPARSCTNGAIAMTRPRRPTLPSNPAPSPAGACLPGGGGEIAGPRALGAAC